MDDLTRSTSSMSTFSTSINKSISDQIRLEKAILKESNEKKRLKKRNEDLEEKLE